MHTSLPKTFSACVVAALMCGGCGGGGGSPPPPPPTSVTQTINAAAGGTINGPGGIVLTIPPDALAADTAITIAQDDTGAPPVPDVLAPLDGPMIALLPHGTTFSAPVTLSMPAAATPETRIYKTNEQRDGWQALVPVQSAGRVETAITSFSQVLRIACPGPPFTNPACACPQPSPLPRIIGEPRDSFTLGEGGFWIFRVDVVACAPYTVRWLRNGFFLPNETNQDILLNPVAFADNGARYSVMVTDAAGRSVTSRAALLTVNATTPVIVTQPVDLQVIAGANASFNAASTSSIAQTLQWKRCAVTAVCPGSTAAWPDANETSTQLTLPGVTLTDSGDRVAMCASNAGGTTCSNTATLTVIAQPVAPTILDQPDAVATAVGRSASFTVLAAGGGLAYQWERSDNNGPFVAINGQTSATHTISNVAVADDGARFRVIVNNTVGTIVSDVAGLTVASMQGVALTRLGGGDEHSIGLKANGRLFAWGANDGGQLGNGTTGAVTAPVQVNTLDDAATFAVGAQHSLALRSDGSVWAWGVGASGQLGSGDIANRPAPFAVPGVPASRTIAAGATHSLTAAANGDLWAWGDNRCGMLGDGTVAPRLGAVSVPFTGAVRVAAGFRHSAALRADGSVWTWGCNSYGQLGDGTSGAKTRPTPIGGVTEVISIAAGFDHTVALTADGAVYAWGFNLDGQVGNAASSRGVLAPVRVALPGVAIAVAAGDNHSLALLADGSVYAWGSNSYGQIGNGSNVNVTVPERVGAPLPNGIVAIGAGAVHSVALDATGAVWAWGRNDARQLADGTQLNRERPVQAIGLNLN